MPAIVASAPRVAVVDVRFEVTAAGVLALAEQGPIAGQVVEIGSIQYAILDGRLHWLHEESKQWRPDMTREQVVEELTELLGFLRLYDAREVH